MPLYESYEEDTGISYHIVPPKDMKAKPGSPEYNAFLIRFILIDNEFETTLRKGARHNSFNISARSARLRLTVLKWLQDNINNENVPWTSLFPGISSEDIPDHLWELIDKDLAIVSECEFYLTRVWGNKPESLFKGRRKLLDNTEQRWDYTDRLTSKRQLTLLTEERLASLQGQPTDSSADLYDRLRFMKQSIFRLLEAEGEHDELIRQACQYYFTLLRSLLLDSYRMHFYQELISQTLELIIKLDEHGKLEITPEAAELIENYRSYVTDPTAIGLNNNYYNTLFSAITFLSFAIGIIATSYLVSTLFNDEAVARFEEKHPPSQSYFDATPIFKAIVWGVGIGMTFLVSTIMGAVGLSVDRGGYGDDCSNVKTSPDILARSNPNLGSTPLRNIMMFGFVPDVTALKTKAFTVDMAQRNNLDAIKPTKLKLGLS